MSDMEINRERIREIIQMGLAVKYLGIVQQMRIMFDVPQPDTLKAFWALRKAGEIELDDMPPYAVSATDKMIVGGEAQLKHVKKTSGAMPQ